MYIYGKGRTPLPNSPEWLVDNFHVGHGWFDHEESPESTVRMVVGGFAMNLAPLEAMELARTLLVESGEALNRETSHERRKH